MAYLALARKWRPKAFSEVVGQSHVVQALSNALDSGRVHHAFLFTGTRGVGKTTLARIFAKSLNCEEGVSAEPCQKCSTCISIDEGRYVDLIEVDAASRTKVDDTRELLEKVQYAPTYGKVKVFLIDEVHMLSTHSFNALLKTLEEPPEHVKFLFATTDPQKLPVTVLSRCLQFNLRAMRPEQVENQLVSILGKESIEFDQAALHAVAKAADGSMRDGLSLLDQAIAQGGGNGVRLADVEGMLGTIKSEHTEAILKALAEQNVDQALEVVADMADCAVDFSVALDDVLMQLYYVSLAQLAPKSLSATDANNTLITQVAQQMSPETLQLFYQIGLISKRDIPLAPSLRVGFEMALLRMLAFEPADNEGPSKVAGILPNSSSENEVTSKNEQHSALDKPIVSVAQENANPAPESMSSSVNPQEQVIVDEPVNSLSASPIQSRDTPHAVKSTVTEQIVAEPSIEQQPVPHAGVNQAPQMPDDYLDQNKVTNNSEPAPWQDVPPEYQNSNTEHLVAPTNSPPQAATVEASSQNQTTHVAQNIQTPQEFAQAQAAKLNDQQPVAQAPQSNANQPPASPQAFDQAQASLIAVTLAGNNEWGELVETTDLQGFAKELAMNCACERLTDERIDLALSPKVQHLLRDDRLTQIQDSLRKVLKPHLEVALEVEESDKETPAECLSRLGFEQQEEVVNNIKSDPAVNAIMLEFGATINEQSIKPV